MHDYNTVGFTHAVVSGTPIKLARLECSICKTDIRVRRPHIQVGDIAILNQDLVENNCLVGAKGEELTVVEIDYDATTETVYRLVGQDKVISATEMYFTHKPKA